MTDKEIIGNLYSKNLELKSKLSTREIDDIFKSKISDEWVIAKALKVIGFNWIVRDIDGLLYAYKNRPKKHSESAEWGATDDVPTLLPRTSNLFLTKNCFFGVKWDNEEPTSLDDLLSKGAYL